MFVRTNFFLPARQNQYSFCEDLPARLTFLARGQAFGVVVKPVALSLSGSPVVEFA